MRMINRTAVVVKPRQPFLDWINSTPELDLTEPVTMEDLLDECDVILVPETYSLQDALDWLDPHKPALFAMQLDGWIQLPSTWPKNRNAEVFDQWFSLEAHSMIWDLVDGPILREGDKDFDQAFK
jgi:hypothetical protein